MNRQDRNPQNRGPPVREAGVQRGQPPRRNVQAHPDDDNPPQPREPRQERVTPEKRAKILKEKLKFVEKRIGEESDFVKKYKLDEKLWNSAKVIVNKRNAEMLKHIDDKPLAQETKVINKSIKLGETFKEYVKLRKLQGKIKKKEQGILRDANEGIRFSGHSVGKEFYKLFPSAGLRNRAAKLDADLFLN